MKRKLQQLFALAATMFLGALGAQAQLNGIYTIGGSSPNYTTLSAAISALNANGVSGPVQFVIRTGSYSGTSWRGTINAVAGASSVNRVTFVSQTGAPADVKITVPGTSSDNYIVRLNNANFITFQGISFINTNTSYGRVFDFGSTSSNDSVVNCILTGPTSTSSVTTGTLAPVYANSHTGSNNVFYNNVFNNGANWIYWYGSGTTTTSNTLQLINNKFNMTSSGYYGIRSYYTSGLKVLNNEFNYNGSSTFYANYIYYPNDDVEISDNIYDLTSTSTLYGMYCYYANYYSLNTINTPKIHNNKINTTNTSGSTYPMYTYYMHYGTVLNNEINSTSTTGVQYLYAPLYYTGYSRAENNVINMKATSSGTLYCYSAYNGASWPDTVRNNIITMQTSGGTVGNYVGYYGNTLVYDNSYTTINTTGTTYNYFYYSNGIDIHHNKIKSTSTTGTIYGAYMYNTTSYSGGAIHDNDFELTSTSTGTVYGLYAYYSNGEKFYNNVITTKTNGTDYGLYSIYVYNADVKNNTFYSMGASGTQYGIYLSSGDIKVRNNIFSRVGNSTGSIGIYTAAAGLVSDYNLYDFPAGNLYGGTSVGTTLQGWRSASGNDMNSLVYSVPFVNATNRDLRIDPASPGAWAVNGRAEHDTTIKTDMAGNARPLLVQNGVPDMGAYEVSPTSTPPNAVAIPASPVANSTQVFTFGQDTVATIDWGASVPSSYAVRQYTGVQAGPMPAGVGRMYFYMAATPTSWIHPHTPHIYYKEPWIGDIPGGESEAVIARSSNSGAWIGYNYANAATDIANNMLAPASQLDSVGSYTGVQNGRIGIRCVENPKGVSFANITANSADINWQPVFNPIGYQVVVKTIKEAPSAAGWAGASFPTTNSLAANGLTEDTKYYVYVRSVCGINDTSGYTLDSFTTLITCHDPLIVVSDVTDTRAVISWQNVKTAISYEYIMTKSPNPPSYGTTVNKNNVLAPFLDPGTQYYVHVRAHCSSIYPNSNWSSAQFMTQWKTGINDVVSAHGLSVYPNPAKDELVIQLKEVTTANGMFNILDMTGKAMLSQPANGDRVIIDISLLPAGIYIAQYTNDGYISQVKFNKL